MRNRRLARSLLYLVCLLSLTPGCQAFHSYRPVGVLVQDAETKRPIPAAEVYLTYPLMKDSTAPCNSSGISREDGIARLRAAPYGKYGIQVKALAQGYQLEETTLGVSTVEKLETAHLFEETDKRPRDIVVEMYADPRFMVELIVPAGYRGLVKAELQVQDDAPCTPGQRSFRYEVSPTGIVVAKGPSVLGRITVLDYRASYLNGTQLGEDMDAVKVGFRWLKTEGKEQFFVVGTQGDYDALRRRLVPDEVKREIHSSDGGGKGGGRGGRHHQGGQSSS